MSTLIKQVIKAGKTLPEEQLREVSNFIKSLKNQTVHKNLSQPPSGRELLEILQHEGLIEEFPDLEAEDEPELDPISYTGKPFSETIIEDRGPK
jgi:hypothetical protein